MAGRPCWHPTDMKTKHAVVWGAYGSIQHPVKKEDSQN